MTVYHVFSERPCRSSGSRYALALTESLHECVLANQTPQTGPQRGDLGPANVQVRVKAIALTRVASIQWAIR